MSRRTAVALCLAFGLLSVPGVALADPLWRVPSDVPGAWDGHDRGDVCEHRGDPPCHTTTTTPPTGASSVEATTTTTTDVSGTVETSVTTSTGTTTSDTPVTSTTGVEGTTSAVVTTVSAGAPSPPRPASSVNTALAATGVMPLWTGLGGLVVLLAGAVLLVFARRRRA